MVRARRRHISLRRHLKGAKFSSPAALVLLARTLDGGNAMKGWFVPPVVIPFVSCRGFGRIWPEAQESSVTGPKGRQTIRKQEQQPRLVVRGPLGIEPSRCPSERTADRCLPLSGLCRPNGEFGWGRAECKFPARWLRGSLFARCHG